MNGVRRFSALLCGLTILGALVCVGLWKVQTLIFRRSERQSVSKPLDVPQRSTVPERPTPVDHASVGVSEGLDRLEQAVASTYEEADVERYADVLASLQRQLNDLRSNPAAYLSAISALEAKMIRQDASPSVRVLLALLLGLNGVPSSLRQLQQYVVAGDGALAKPSLLGLCLGERSGLARRAAVDAKYWRSMAVYLRSEGLFSMPGAVKLVLMTGQPDLPHQTQDAFAPDEELEAVSQTLGKLLVSKLREGFPAAISAWPKADLWILVDSIQLDDPAAVDVVCRAAIASDDVRLSNTVIDAVAHSRTESAEQRLTEMSKTLDAGNARAYALYMVTDISKDRGQVLSLVRDALAVDSDVDVSRVATEFLAFDPTPESLDVIQRAASQGLVTRRVAVIKALRQVGMDVHTREKFNLCARLCFDQEPTVRAAALTTANSLDAQQAKHLARQLLSDPAQEVSSVARLVLQEK